MIDKNKYIGKVSDDKLLKVVDVFQKGLYNTTTFKVQCEICSKDSELFPEKTFDISMSNFNKGVKPCGCSCSPRWNESQFKILVKRITENIGIKFIRFAEEFKGAKTRLILWCNKDNTEWNTTTINKIMSGKRGCPECRVRSIKDKQKLSYNVVSIRCEEICKDMGYTYLGFPTGYDNKNSRFEYLCHTHGVQNVSYDKFINGGNRCKGCARDSGAGFYGYYPERKDETDFLYVLDFDGQFIKVGRSFDIDDRIGNLKTPSVSGIKNIIKLRIFTATHEEIYDLEQAVLDELRERGFQYYVGWSRECFENDCLYSLNKLLDICGLTEVKTKERTNDYT